MKKCLLKHVIYMTKLFAIAFMIQCLSMSMLLASNGNAQVKSIEEVKVYLSLKDTQLEQAFKEIEKKTRYNFVFADREISGLPAISFESEGKTLYEVLQDIAGQSNLSFKQVDENIHVKRSDKSKGVPVSQAVEVAVSGKVTDAKGQPLPGATITIEGTSRGTVTDIDGNYEIEVQEGAVLIFSFIGYESARIEVGNQSQINVSLADDTSALEEVVVVGYGTQRRENLTGAVGTADLNDAVSRPVTNSSALLQGKVSGVYALQKSGKPGGDDAEINIRGIGTLNNSSPLVLVDGFPANINDVNPIDIESVSVLKDASSAAIYGNRAANGVILITTKRGSAKELSVNYNNYFGVQQATALPNVLNAVQYTTLYNEAATNTGMQPRYTSDDIARYAAGNDPMYPDINYFDVYYSPAQVQNHRVSMSGGSDKLNFAFMTGYLDQDGILEGTGYKKFDFRSNIDGYLLKDQRLRVSARLSGNRGVTTEPTNEWQAKWYASNSPIWPLKNEQGQWVAVIGERNYYGEIKEGSTRQIERYTFNGQFEAEYEFFDGFSAQVTSGYNLIGSNTNAFNANVLLANLDGSTRVLASELNERDDYNSQTLFTSLLKYRRNIGKHNFNLLAGYQEEEFNWRWSSGSRLNFINNSQRTLNLGDPSTMQNNAGKWDLGLQSVFGRVNYIFDDKYLLEANIRRDGSSRFGQDYKWGTFPSFSAGWILSEEDFLQNISWIDHLKVRGSWGRLGNQNINTFYAASDILASNQNYSFGGNLYSGVAVTAMSNRETSWETTEQTNIGIDLRINQNIDVSVDYFNKKTKDILMQVPIPVTMGNLTPPFQNVGEVVNSGLELTGSYRKVFDNGLKFNSILTFASIRNKITDLYGRSPIINGVSALVEGAAIHSFYGYIQDGIYQIDDFNWQNNSDPNIAHVDRDYQLRDDVVQVANFTPQPGDVKYRDLTGDGIVDMENDRTVIGNQFPDFSYSLQLNFEWKQFDLGMFLQGLQGINGYTYYEIATPFSGAASNLGAWWLDRWTPENPSNSLPRLTLDGVRNNIHSTLYMEDASYLRIKNIEIGYSLSPKVTESIGIGSLRVFANVQNAFTFTKFRGFDPEQTTGETRAQAYPQVRIMNLGLNVNF